MALPFMPCQRCSGLGVIFYDAYDETIDGRFVPVTRKAACPCGSVPGHPVRIFVNTARPRLEPGFGEERPQ